MNDAILLNIATIFNNDFTPITSNSSTRTYINIFTNNDIPSNISLRMNKSTLMDDCEIGANSIVGALCFIPANTIIAERKVVVGNPAKVVKDVSDEMIDWKSKGTALYQKLPNDLIHHFLSHFSIGC